MAPGVERVPSSAGSPPWSSALLESPDCCAYMFSQPAVAYTNQSLPVPLPSSLLLQDNSQDAIQFLEAAGVNLSGLVQLGGHSRKRTHNNPTGPNVGFAIMKALHDKQAQTPGISLVTSAHVRGLCMGGPGLRLTQGGRQGKGGTGALLEERGSAGSLENRSTRKLGRQGALPLDELLSVNRGRCLPRYFCSSHTSSQYHPSRGHADRIVRAAGLVATCRLLGWSMRAGAFRA